MGQARALDYLDLYVTVHFGKPNFSARLTENRRLRVLGWWQLVLSCSLVDVEVVKRVRKGEREIMKWKKRKEKLDELIL